MTALGEVGKILGAAAGMFLVLGGWVLIQNWVRRYSTCQNPDKDVLEFLLHGCGGGCGREEACHGGELAESKLR